MFKIITHFSFLLDNYFNSIYSKAEARLQNLVLVNLKAIGNLDLVKNELIDNMAEVFVCVCFNSNNKYLLCPYQT